MAKSKQSFSKKEKEAKRLKKRKDKDEKRDQRKTEGKKSFEDMIAYVDEFGNLSSTPPDPKARTEMKLEDIQLGARVETAEEAAAAAAAPQGRISYYNDEKGYGFIKHQITKESIFFHMDNVNGEVKMGDLVMFQVSKGAKGPVAIGVVKIG